MTNVCVRFVGHSSGSKLRPKVLQHVPVPVIENQVCESWHRRKGIDIRIYDEMMCAGYELGQRDACQVSISFSIQDYDCPCLIQWEED